MVSVIAIPVTVHKKQSNWFVENPDTVSVLIYLSDL
jgi:hypothetical protein